MPSEFLFNHRFVYQNEVQDDNEPPKAEKADKKLEAPATIEGSKEFADQQVNKAEKDGGVSLENNKWGDNVPNPEFLTGEKLARLAKEQPQIILGSPESMDAKLIETAARAGAEKCPAATIGLDRAFIKEPYHREVLMIAFNNMLKPGSPDSRGVMEQAIAKLGDSPATRALISKAQKINPQLSHYA